MNISAHDGPNATPPVVLGTRKVDSWLAAISWLGSPSGPSRTPFNPPLPSDLLLESASSTLAKCGVGLKSCLISISRHALAQKQLRHPSRIPKSFLPSSSVYLYHLLEPKFRHSSSNDDALGGSDADLSDAFPLQIFKDDLSP